MENNNDFRGNKGEWAEIYIFLKLLADGKLYAADRNLKKIDDTYLDENGRFHLNQSGLVTYSHGEYFLLGKKLGTFGYSVAKKKTQKKKRTKR